MEVIIFRVFLIQESSGDVRHIAPRVALSSHVDLEVLDPEDVLEVLEELNKVRCGFFLGGSGGGTEGETSPDRLIDPFV